MTFNELADKLHIEPTPHTEVIVLAVYRRDNLQVAVPSTEGEISIVGPLIEDAARAKRESGPAGNRGSS